MEKSATYILQWGQVSKKCPFAHPYLSQSRWRKIIWHRKKRSSVKHGVSCQNRMYDQVVRATTRMTFPICRYAFATFYFLAMVCCRVVPLAHLQFCSNMPFHSFVRCEKGIFVTKYASSLQMRRVQHFRYKFCQFLTNFQDANFTRLRRGAVLS